LLSSLLPRAGRSDCRDSSPFRPIELDEPFLEPLKSKFQVLSLRSMFVAMTVMRKDMVQANRGLCLVLSLAARLASGSLNETSFFRSPRSVSNRFMVIFVRLLTQRHKLSLGHTMEKLRLLVVYPMVNLAFPLFSTSTLS